MTVKWLLLFRHTSSVQLMHLHLSNRAPHLQRAHPLKAAFGVEDEEELQDLTVPSTRSNHVLTIKSVQNG